MLYFVLTVVIVGIAMTAMGIGLFFGRRCIRGSCGGPDVLDAKGGPITCSGRNGEDKALSQDKVPA